MKYLKKDVLRLAATYLTIIMVMSIGFSIIFYTVSTRELERRPRGGPDLMLDSGASLQQYFDQREQESRAILALDLAIINIIAFIVGGLLSYLLAERTLRPIEENMEAQAQFVSDASHELRTPLTALRTANEVALRNKQLKLADAKKVIAENVEDIARLQSLTDSMLGLIREDHNDVMSERVLLAAVVSDAMNLVVPKALAKDITIEDSGKSLWVRGDQQQLVQLLTILMDNAIKYSPVRSMVHVSVHTKGKMAILTVKDEGVGMSSETQQQIFTRFYRADQSRSVTHGYGLGLSIAKKIVEAHKGTIHVTSQEGSGSIFTVELHLAN